MIICDPIFVELCKRQDVRYARVGDDSIMVLPDDYSQEEIEEFRAIDKRYFRFNEAHIIANFADDDERPADVPKL